MMEVGRQTVIGVSLHFMNEDMHDKRLWKNTNEHWKCMMWKQHSWMQILNKMCIDTNSRQTCEAGICDLRKTMRIYNRRKKNKHENVDATLWLSNKMMAFWWRSMDAFRGAWPIHVFSSSMISTGTWSLLFICTCKTFWLADRRMVWKSSTKNFPNIWRLDDLEHQEIVNKMRIHWMKIGPVLWSPQWMCVF